MAKPRLLVLTGAGSSIDIGMPSTSDLNKLVKYIKEPKVNGVSYIKTVWDILEDGYDKPNFEHLLYALEILADFKTPEEIATVRPPLDQNIATNTVLLELKEELAASHSSSNANSAILKCYREILKEIYCRSKRLTTKTLWKQNVDFWNQLCDAYDPIVVTLNYGDEIEQASGLENNKGFKEVQGCSFLRLTPKEFFKELTSPQVIHLHGFMKFGYGPPPGPFELLDDFHDIYYHENVKNAFFKLNHTTRSQPRTPTGSTSYVEPVIVGLNKRAVLEYSPYRYYHHAFEVLLRDIRNVLIIGYGFSDAHINQMLKRARNFDNDKKKRFLLITWSDAETVSDLVDNKLRNSWQIITSLGSCSKYGFKEIKGELINGDSTCAIWWHGYGKFLEGPGPARIKSFFD